MRFVTDKSKEAYMYKCTNCGSEFDGKFCPECGTKRVDELICPDCGAKATAGARFCAECGYSFAQPVKPAPANAEPSAVKNAQPAQRVQSVQPATYGDEPVVKSASAPAADERSDQPEQKKRSGNPLAAIAKVYKVLRFTPLVMAGLFAVSLFLFYLAPIAEVPELAMLGEDGGLGSVYSVIEELKVISIALIIFAAIAVIFVLVAAKFTFGASKRDMEVNMFGRFDLTLGEVVSSLSVLLYLAAVILAGVAMGQVSALNDDEFGGMGMFSSVVESGAALKLVMAFAIIFTVFAAAAVVARVFIGKKFPELWQKESSVRAERRAKREAEIAAKNLDGMPVVQNAAPLAEAKIERGVKPLLYYAYSNKKAQRAVFASVLCLTFTMLAVVVFMMIGTSGAYYLVSPHWIILIGACCMVLFSALCFIMPVYNWSPESLRYKDPNETRRGKKSKEDSETPKRDEHSDKPNIDKSKMRINKFVFLFILLSWASIFPFSFGFTVAGGVLVGYLIADIFGIAACVALMVAEHAVAKRNGAMAEYLFGCKNPIAGTPLVVEYNAEIQRAAYLNYKADVKEKRAKNDEPDVKKKSTKRRVKFAVASALIVVFSVAAVIASPLLTDRFSANYVSRFIGKKVSDAGLGSQLGAPSVVRNIGKDSAVLEYYSDNYREIVERISKLEKQAEKAETDGDLEKFMEITAQIDSLQKRALTTTYQSLSVYINQHFYRRGNYNEVDTEYNYADEYEFYDAKITGIILDANRCEASPDARKNVKKVVCDGITVLQHSEPSAAGVYSEVYYTDGSYRYMPMADDALVGMDTSKLGKQTVKVRDEWGEYTVTVNVVSSMS